MVTQNLATQAILSVMGGKKAFCKFLSANDTGKTGGHQAGIYIAKPAVPIIFEQPFEKGHASSRDEFSKPVKDNRGKRPRCCRTKCCYDTYPLHILDFRFV